MFEVVFHTHYFIHEPFNLHCYIWHSCDVAVLFLGCSNVDHCTLSH